MRLYLAHNIAARKSLRPVCSALESKGHTITSRWITDDAHILESMAEQSALADLADIDRSDALVLFTDQYAERPGRGKFVELGYALGKGKKVYLCGSPDPSCVFYRLPGLTRVSRVDVEAGRL